MDKDLYQEVDLQCIWTGCKREMLQRAPKDEIDGLIVLKVEADSGVIRKGSALGKMLVEKRLARKDAGWLCPEHAATAGLWAETPPLALQEVDFIPSVS